MSGGKAKKDSPPTGPEHQPPAVAARKARTLRMAMAELNPKIIGSAAYRRARGGSR